jgi:hypothetical protein
VISPIFLWRNIFSSFWQVHLSKGVGMRTDEVNMAEKMLKHCLHTTFFFILGQDDLAM